MQPMGIVIRQSAKSVFLTYVGIGFGILNTLWLFPRILSEEQIGLVRTLINVAVLFSTFAALGAGNIPTKFFPYFKDIKKNHNGFLFFQLAVGAAGFLLFVILYLNLDFLFAAMFRKNSPVLLKYFYQIIPFTLILIFIAIFESYNVIQQNSIIPTFTREVLARVLLSIGLIALFFIRFDFDWFITLLIGSYGLMLLVLIFYTHSQKYLFVKPNAGVVKSNLFKSILIYEGLILMGNASGVIINNVDSLMLSAYSGLKFTGIYTIAFFIATFIDIPKKSLSQVLVPLVSEASKENNVNKLEELYKKSSSTQLVIGGILFLLIWFNIDNIFKLIPHGDIYAQGKWVVFFIGIGKMFDMTLGINQEIVGTSKYYKIDLALYPLYGILAVGANIILIPKLGLVGAALATLLSVVIINSVRFFFLLFTLKIQPFTAGTVKTLLIFCLVFVANILLPHIQNHFVMDVAVRSSILTLVYVALLLVLNVSEDITMVIKKTVTKITLIINGKKN